MKKKKGTIVIPIFEFVKAYKPNKYTPVNNNTVNQAARVLPARTFNQFMDSKKIDLFKI